MVVSVIVSIRQFHVPVASICLLCYSLSHLEGIQKYAGLTKATAMKSALINALLCYEVIVTLHGFKHHLRDAPMLIAK